MYNKDVQGDRKENYFNNVHCKKRCVKNDTSCVESRVQGLYMCKI